MSSPYNVHFEAVGDKDESICLLCLNGEDNVLEGTRHAISTKNSSTTGKIKHLQSSHRTAYDAIRIKQLEIQLATAQNVKQPVISMGSIQPFSEQQMKKAKRLATMTSLGDLRPLSAFESDTWLSKFSSYISHGRVKSFDHGAIMKESIDIELEIKLGEYVYVYNNYSFIHTKCIYILYILY